MQRFVLLRSQTFIQIFEQVLNLSHWSCFQTPSRWFLLNTIQQPGFNYYKRGNFSLFSIFFPFFTHSLSASLASRALLPQILFSNSAKLWRRKGSATVLSGYQEVEKPSFRRPFSFRRIRYVLFSSYVLFAILSMFACVNTPLFEYSNECTYNSSKNYT